MFAKRKEIQNEINNIKARKDKVYKLIVAERKENIVSKELDKVYVELDGKLEVKQNELEKLNIELGYKVDPIDILMSELNSVDANNKAIYLLKDSLKKLKSLERNNLMLRELIWMPGDVNVFNIENELGKMKFLDKNEIKKRLNEEINRQKDAKIAREKEEAMMNDLKG